MFRYVTCFSDDDMGIVFVSLVLMHSLSHLTAMIILKPNQFPVRGNLGWSDETTKLHEVAESKTQSHSYEPTEQLITR